MSIVSMKIFIFSEKDLTKKCNYIIIIRLNVMTKPHSPFTERILDTQKYSRGRRGAPAKGVGRVTGARVQISPSA